MTTPTFNSTALDELQLWLEYAAKDKKVTVRLVRDYFRRWRAAHNSVIVDGVEQLEQFVGSDSGTDEPVEADFTD
jgi:hypothetical protein